jgi:hypothetical protein
MFVCRRSRGNDSEIAPGRSLSPGAYDGRLSWLVVVTKVGQLTAVCMLERAYLCQRCLGAIRSVQQLVHRRHDTRKYRLQVQPRRESTWLPEYHLWTTRSRAI